MWAAPNEPEGPGGIIDGRSAYETDVRAPQKLEAAEMRGFEATFSRNIVVILLTS